MRKVFMSLVVMLMLSVSFTMDFKSSEPVDSTSKIEKTLDVNFFPVAYAQEEGSGSGEAVEPSGDLGEYKLEIPAWVGSIVEFLKSVPHVGPVLVKALGYMGIVVSILTLLASLLMGVSQIMAMITKKDSPKWMHDAKKWLDWLTDVSKYLSVYNAQKKDSNS